MGRADGSVKALLETQKKITWLIFFHWVFDIFFVRSGRLPLLI